MPREKDLVKNSFVLSLGTVLPRLVQLIITPILTGCLTKEEYGTYDIILVLVNLLLPAASMQVHAGAFRFLIDCREDKKRCVGIISNVYAIIVPASLLVLTGLFFCYRSLACLSRALMCLYLLADILMLAGLSALRGFKQNSRYAVCMLLNALTKLIFCAVTVGALKVGLNGALLSLIFANTVSFFYLLFGCRLYTYINIKAVSFSVMKELLSYSLPLVPNNLSAWVIRVSDRLVVTGVLGAAVNGLYAAACKIPHIFSIMLGTVSMAWQENASSNSKEEDAPAYYSFMFEKTYETVAGCLCLMLAATPLLFRVLIRGDYWEGYPQIPIIFFAAYFKSMADYHGGIYIALKKTRSLAVSSGMAAALNLIINILFIRRIGLYAATLSTVASYILLLAFRVWDIRKYVKIRYDLKRVFAIFALVLAGCILCYLNTPVSIGINALLGLGAFILLNRRFVRVFWQKRAILKTKLVSAVRRNIPHSDK